MAMPKLERGLPGVTVTLVSDQKSSGKRRADFAQAIALLVPKTLAKSHFWGVDSLPRADMNSHGRQLSSGR